MGVIIMVGLEVLERNRTLIGSDGYFESVWLGSDGSSPEKFRVDTLRLSTGTAKISIGFADVEGKSMAFIDVREGGRVRSLVVDRGGGVVYEFAGEVPETLRVGDPVDFANRLFSGGLTAEEASKLREIVGRLGGLSGFLKQVKIYRLSTPGK